MKHKLKNIAGLGLVSVITSVAAMAQEDPDPIGDLTSGVDSLGTLGLSIAGISVTLFLIALTMRFVRKGARG